MGVCHGIFGWGFGGGLMGLLLTGLVIYAVVMLVNGAGQKGGRHTGGSEALDVLNERYARGEMTDDEYMRKKAMLTG
ncbi:SHOCT domain-containing protein [Thermoanaerobacterium sp. DL9XJH110]|jgi:putative membrane protein|uniref:SHOCT domain-containing protein n=1 Tax=Thermoanaerobacterium sp. DL9XJH110 TaxID=3386643 RepID=UPI003BB7C103